jgi:hypothetical protein
LIGTSKTSAQLVLQILNIFILKFKHQCSEHITTCTNFIKNSNICIANINQSARSMDREIERELDLGRGRSIGVGIRAPGSGHQGRGRGAGVGPGR